ncbi:MAG: bifunctional [glutamate--ammonia ligase]-adenylyl-L-tyrosine phosphorylase/[glutamate--ammonia-ligase] adenylyltransferase [Thermodesulfobacteriota bacterium]
MHTPIHFPEALLSESTNRWKRFMNAAHEAGVRVPTAKRVVDSAKRVFTFSEFIFKTAIRNPKLLEDLLMSGDLETSYPEPLYLKRMRHLCSGITDEAELMISLRRMRCREMVRIAWRDLSGLSDFYQTAADLTRFADAAIGEASRILYQWESAEHGVPESDSGDPQTLCVVAMGKLGGEELNFSSDVDLIFAYPEPGKTRGARKSISHEEFFSRLCRKLIKILGSPTAEGIVFRVDTRLRPDGDSGPIVMSYDGMEQYYQSQGREWERYAWIKARIVAPRDHGAGETLLKRLNPFVYRRYLDYGTIESLREMKRKISMELRRRKVKEDIKLGPGGIREIEFFGQIFQLIRGGVEPMLQERSILKVLERLNTKGYIPAQTFEELKDAYLFLRNAENRLQEFSDQQTHHLPQATEDRLRLSASMGFDDWNGFAQSLEKHMKIVHRHFQGLLKEEASRPISTGKSREERLLSDLSGVWQLLIGHEEAVKVLRFAGFSDPEATVKQLNALREDPATRALSPEGRMRLDRLMPLVLRQAGKSEEPERALGHILDLIKTIQRRTSYLALLLENPAALSHLVRLVTVSPWIASFLSSHPVLLDELLDERTLYAPPKIETLKGDLKGRMARLNTRELEYQLEELCVFKQVNTLRVAASDITGVLPLMKVSDHLSGIAEAILEEVLDLSWGHLVERHGIPQCRLGGRSCEKGFAMVAYGKLGGLELGYKSDLDLVFLHAGIEGPTVGGTRPIDNAQFFARLGQRVVHILTSRSSAGTLYEADMRLRPSGSGGILVSHIEAFRDYQIQEAWTWEHQALIRARPIGGDLRLAERFQAIRREVLTHPRDGHKLQSAVREMRERMRKEHLKEDAGEFDLKQGRGGIVDIEFLVQYLVLLKASEYPDLIRWTDNVRILQSLSETGVIEEETAFFLRKSYLIYRSTVHRLNLREKSSRIGIERFSGLRRRVAEIWDERLGAGNG